jgi:hypothetical protein
MAPIDFASVRLCRLVAACPSQAVQTKIASCGRLTASVAVDVTAEAGWPLQVVSRRHSEIGTGPARYFCCAPAVGAFPGRRARLQCDRPRTRRRARCVPDRPVRLRMPTEECVRDHVADLGVDTCPDGCGQRFPQIPKLAQPAHVQWLILGRRRWQPTRWHPDMRTPSGRARSASFGPERDHLRRTCHNALH